MTNIDFDTLFEYLSYVESGSLNQFNSYLSNMCYERDLENYEKTNIRRMFSRLGHIEFDYIENKFSVCPTTVCILPNTNKGILAGMRTKDILNYIEQFYHISVTDNNFAPKCLTINIPDINTFRINLPQIRISQNFTKNLLHLLPGLDDIEKTLVKLDHSPISASFPTRLYNIYKHSFEDYKPINFYKDGLYEIKYYSNRQYYLYRNKKWHKIEKEYGKFLLEKDEILLKYSSNQLLLKSYMRFPELLDRALVMNSGVNPIKTSGYIVYDNIDIATAQKVSSLLDQNLEL